MVTNYVAPHRDVSRFEPHSKKALRRNLSTDSVSFAMRTVLVRVSADSFDELGRFDLETLGQFENIQQ